ncbi:MAG TPA: carbohydrate porin [Chiayiivirga sp.]|nr:carbohydrate porin [Chiayiivirga sp.]
MRFKQIRLAAIAATSLAAASFDVAADGRTNVAGKVFFDVAHRSDKRQAAVDSHASRTRVNLKRLYLELDQRIDPVWSLKLVSDFQYAGDDGSTDAFVKKAYIEGRFGSKAVLRIGAADTPWLSALDKAQGFRYIERSLVDRLKFGHSADWGLHVSGRLGRVMPVDYGVSLVNGRGYKRSSRSQGVDIEARIAVQPIENVVVALGAYTGKPNTERDGAPAVRSARRYNASIAYVGARTRVGGELFRSHAWNELDEPIANRAQGWSLWASHGLAERLTVVARLDRADTAEQTDPNAADRYAHAGLEYRWSDRFQLALVWKDTLREYSFSHDDQIQVGRRRGKEIGLWGQFVF